MNTDHNITEVEINGAMIPFDFTMSTVLKFVQLKSGHTPGPKYYLPYWMREHYGLTRLNFSIWP